MGGLEDRGVGQILMGSLGEVEQAYAEALHPLRRSTWIAGRVAIHCALARAGVAAGPVLPDDRGAPQVPGGMVGSISHKDTIAVALVGPDQGWKVGVDIETIKELRQDISRHVLTREERGDIDRLRGETRDLAILTRFSVKEAIYKAIDPYLRRYVGFKEMWVRPSPDGSVEIRPILKSGEEITVEARWSRYQNYILSYARAHLENG